MDAMSSAPHGNRRTATAAAWAVLVAMGGTEMTFNVYHSVHSGSLDLALALLVGIAPVFAAMCLSHIVAEGGAGTGVKTLTFLVMLGAMGLSIGAVSDVIRPVTGPAMSWLFGLVLDAAALLALRMILAGRSQKAAAGTELEDALRRLEEARAAAAGSAAVIAESESAAAELRAELAAAKAELERAELRAEVLASSARKPARSSARSSAPGSARNRSTSSARNQTASSGPEPDGETDDLTTEAQALNILAKEPDISGSQLGLRLGKSDRYGRELLKRLAPVTPRDGQLADTERAE
jgi:hypothetical protein